MNTRLGTADGEHLDPVRRTTLTNGRLFAILAVLMAVLFAFQDPALARLGGGLGWALVGVGCALLYLLASVLLLPRRPRLIVACHAVCLFGVQAMCAGFAGEALLRPSAYPGAGAPLIAGALLSFIFAEGARRYLAPVLLLPVAGTTIALVVGGQTLAGVSIHLSVAWLLALAFAALSLLSARDSRGLDGTRTNEELAAEIDRLRKEIEERKAVEALLEKRAAIDDLTGAYNRRAGLEILKQSIYLSQRNSQALSLCYVDIDDLKTVNDNFGHPEGDALIRRVIEVIRRHLRKSDYVCRLGGDEFVVILPNCSEAAARAILLRIKQDLAEQAETERRFPIDVSYGLSEYAPGGTMAMDELMRVADSNMYLNKQSKKLKTAE